MAAGEVFGQLEGIGTNTTIWHDGSIENDFSSTDIEGKHFSSSEVNTSEFSIPWPTFFQLSSSKNSIGNYPGNSRLEENRIGKVSSFQVDPSKATFPEISPSEVSKAHITIQNPCITEFRISKIDISEDTTTKGGFTAQENTLAHISSSEIGSLGDQLPPAKDRARELQSRQVESAKISFPSIVSIQQLDNSHLSHDNTSLLTSIYSTAQSIWHSNIAIDLNFAITNLPTGQLAEATITGYDQNGRPNTATISIDTDANGVGWFLDSTPVSTLSRRLG